MGRLYDEAHEALSKGELRQAADLCKQMLDEEPGNPQGYFLMSSLFSAAGNHQKAFDFSALAISMDASVAQFHLQQGHVLYTLKEYAQAQHSFKQVTQLLPTQSEGPLWVANCLAAMERLREAEEWFTLARSRENTWCNDAYEGRAYMQNGQLEKAAFYFDRLLKEYPICVEAHVLRAELHSKTKQNTEAKWLLRKALLLDPNHAHALYLLALLLAEEGQETAAAHAAMQSVQIAPTKVESLLLMGYIFQRLSDDDSAEKAFNHALAMAPHHPLARYEILLFLSMRGRAKEAMALAKNHAALGIYHDVDQFVHSLLRGEMPSHAPKLFSICCNNAYAESFEPWLISKRAATAANIVGKALAELPELTDKQHVSLLDLGCGVGLLAESLQPMLAICAGVDSSPSMLAIAKRSPHYDVCYEMDLVDCAEGSEAQFDIVACVSALRRTGNVQPFFQSVRNVMHSNSILAVMLGKEASTLAYTLQLSGYYAHNAGYVCDVAQAEGFRLLSQKEYMLKTTQEGLVQHHLFLFKKVTFH